MKRIILFIILAIFVGIGVFLWFLYNKPHADLASTAPDFTISANTLYEDYEADEVAADAKYLGKILEISGRVQTSDNDQENNKKIILNTGDPLSEIQCIMAENNHEEVEIGEEISLRCICTGKLMDIVLNKCVLIKK